MELGSRVLDIGLSQSTQPTGLQARRPTQIVPPK